ncbi:hypothetical protein [Pseudomonas sp. UFMG81]|uniref:hypothetical protein n=1 Tax=Pseudomonas sp. UFMG81 TaxID=2745936 RepID=UPI001E2FE2ED|nr:hypothetical protein [Pseudomonas sp. UFMG81]
MLVAQLVGVSRISFTDALDHAPLSFTVVVAKWYGLFIVALRDLPALGEASLGTLGSSSQTSPYLSRFATPRTGEDSIPGYYSSELNMWAIDSSAGVVPIITDGVLNELMTKTKVNAEQDDEACWQIELLTKTYQKVESDDDDPSPYRGQSSSELRNFDTSNHLLQLVTKTDANTERDDRCEVNHILELITKTNVELERDDNGDPTFGLDTRYYSD